MATSAENRRIAIISQKNRAAIALLFCALLVLPALAYLPGLNGPFLFDDYTNILNNDFVKVETLDGANLYHGAYSLKSGPLQRPLPMLSFTLNYYFAGSFESAMPFKLTNLAIHLATTLSIFWLVHLVFQRAAALGAIEARDVGGRISSVTLLAGAVALLWSLHPMQLTSVLYVVQRMAQLSALFTVLALACYLMARMRWSAGHTHGIWVMVLGVAGFGLLGVYSKENAFLLPFFILALEFVLFSNELPWRVWPQLSIRARIAIWAGLIVSLGLLTAWALNYADSGYGHRPFTLSERLMTEWRVLLMYLSLILLPRISAFGLQHDDITISTSLLNPWTTLAALLVLAGLAVLAIQSRKRYPLLSLGILWFFIAHLLESTILGLEIAHEHRNYLASLGPIVAVVYFVDLGVRNMKNALLWAVIPGLALLYGATTLLRAYEWSDIHTLAHYEALHHPNSARAQAQLGSSLFQRRRYTDAIQVLRRASELDPSETGYLLTQHIIAARAGLPLDEKIEQQITHRLSISRKTTLTDILLQTIGGCIQTTCAVLQEPMEKWLIAIIVSRPRRDNSFYYNLLGRTLVGQDRIAEAITAFERSFEEDPRYLHPLFELINVYIKLGRADHASQVLQQLRHANKNSLHPRDREIETVALVIASMRNATEPRP